MISRWNRCWRLPCDPIRLAFAFLLPWVAAVSTYAEITRPVNVVFILADDLGWGELGCYGQQKIPTPNIDRLAREGMRFTQHYSGAPVCAPSRCVLMTGKHLGHAEVRGNQQARVRYPEFSEGQHPLSEQALLWPQLFRQAGFATGAMGKWGLGPVGSTGAPDRKGFDLFFGYNCQSVAHSYYPHHLWRNSEQIVINEHPIPGHPKDLEGKASYELWLGQTYAPSMMIAEAEKFIDENHERPFLLYLPFIEPHVAMHPPKASVERFPIEWDSEEYKGEGGYLPHSRPRAAYAAMISDLDSYVGRVVAKLEEFGVADRTLIVFSSDNGTTHEGRADSSFHIGGVDAKFFNSTAGLRGYKGSVYEGGIRVPMIARLPGTIAGGTVCDVPSYFADWFPTMCDLLNVPHPAGLDGQSLWPVLNGSDPMGQAFVKTRTPMVWVFPEYNGQVAVRWEDFKLVRQKLKTRQPGPWEVYDLAQDPAEAHDVAAQHAELIARVEDHLRRVVDRNEIFPLSIPQVID